MNYLKWIVGGGVAGIVGAAIWAAIVHYTNYEVGYVAWGVGAAVGYGVRKMAGQEEGVAPGVVAAVIAVLALVARKYAVAMAAVQGNMPDVAQFVTPQSMVVSNAEQICLERSLKGQKLQFPPGKNAENAEKQSDFPADVWKEADERWSKLDPAAQQQQLEAKRTLINQQMQALKGGLQDKLFEKSLGLFDILWLVLAVGSAFKIGANHVGSD